MQNLDSIGLSVGTQDAVFNKPAHDGDAQGPRTTL